MARIELAPEVGDDLDHVAQHGLDGAAARIREIVDAISVLETSPVIGRPAAGAAVDELRELIIGKRTRGFVALYRYAAVIDTVFVLALRSQREAGYSHE